MIAKPYSKIALIYNYLMRSIDYKDWAEYVYNISKRVKKQKLSVLELASGTCINSVYLRKHFGNIISSDLSLSMLRTASNSNMDRVCCNMTSLPFRGKFDFVFSTFDSVNYLLEEVEIKKMFAEVSRVLHDEGIFTFDVSLERNSIKHQKHLNRKGRYEGAIYTQRSRYDKENKLHYNNFDIILADGNSYSEEHVERIYDFNQYFMLLEGTDLMVEACFDAFSFKDANEKSERAQFVLRKRR